MPTPPRWPSGLSEPHPGVCAPPGAGSSRAGAAGCSSMAPIPLSQPGLAWAPAGPSTPPLKPVCSKLFTPLGWDRQSRTGGAPGCSHGGCSPPRAGHLGPCPSQWLFCAVPCPPGTSGTGTEAGRGLGSHPGLVVGVQLAEAAEAAQEPWMLWDVLAGGRGSTERPFPFLRPSPSSDIPISQTFPFLPPHASPWQGQPGSTGSPPPCPHIPPPLVLGGLLSASPAPPGPTEPLPAAAPVQFPFIVPGSHSREVH